MKAKYAASLCLLLLCAIPISADDGNASISAGGVVVMGRETRIMMAKEVLEISIDRVVVDYDFRNDSDEDVTTTVAFPVPDYQYDPNAPPIRWEGFDDFRLWVYGEPISFQIEARAFVKGREATKLLKQSGVDIASFGRASDEYGPAPDVMRLQAVKRKALQNAGAIDEDGIPQWVVRKKYYWQQKFPAHDTVHIRHTYTPVEGAENSIKYGMRTGSTDASSANELKSFCIDGGLQRTLQAFADSKDMDAPYAYVDFILTTANSWKTPIEDFTLRVHRQPKSSDHETNFVSFCWDGPVKKIDADTFEVTAKSFVPRKELRVVFFQVQKSQF